MTSRLIIIVVGCILGLWLISCCTNEFGGPVDNQGKGRFPSSDQNHPLPFDWTGPKFELSQDYPATQPPREEYWWEQIDFTKDPRRYLAEVARYIYEGNIEVDWVVQKNPVRRWFHTPWMHAPEIKYKDDSQCRDEKGREPIRGLTRERASTLAELNYGKDPTQCTNDIENWAVSIYNPPGGFVVGQVWDEMTIHSRSDRYPDPKKFPRDFPIGTVVVKLLFTTASPTLVPYLAGSPEFQADIKRNNTPVTLRLLQLDVAVRDRRAEFDQQNPGTKASGWVFGTYTYDKDSLLFNDGSEKTLPWRRLKPIGLMYGNERHETILAGDDISMTQHLGCDQRLAGPVDNPASSCLACHALAEVNGGDKPLQSIKYSADKNKYDQCRCKGDVSFWFRTLGPGEPFTPGAISLNFSLQLSNGILRYCQHNPGACGPNPPPAIDSATLKPCTIQISNSCPKAPSPNEPGCPAIPEIPNFIYSLETTRGGDQQYPR